MTVLPVRSDADGAGRNRHLAAPAHLSEAGILDNERGVLDGRAAVAGDEACSFEHGHIARPPAPRLAASRHT